MVWQEPLVVSVVPVAVAATQRVESQVLVVLAVLPVMAVLVVPANGVALVDTQVTVQTVALVAPVAAQVLVALMAVVARAVAVETAQSVEQAEQATLFLDQQQMVALVVQVAPAAMLARWVRPDQGLVRLALRVPVARMATVEMAAQVVSD